MRHPAQKTWWQAAPTLTGSCRGADTSMRSSASKATRRRTSGMNWRRSAAHRGMRRPGRNRTLAVHRCTLLAKRVVQSLDGNRLTGCLLYPAGSRCMCRAQFRKTRALHPIRGENTNPLGQFAAPVSPQGGVVISLTVTGDAHEIRRAGVYLRTRKPAQLPPTPLAR